MIIKEYYDLLKSRELLMSCSDNIINSKTEITGIAYHNADVQKGFLFICKGNRFKREYLEDAVKKGAALIVSGVPYEGIDVPFIIVKDIRRTMALVAEYHYQHPQNKLYKVGITGTKGKTTTAYFYKSIVDEYNCRNFKKTSAIFSSVRNYFGEEYEESHLTTPESPDLYRYMAVAASHGIEDLVLEASSQGLKYNRLDGVEFDIGIFLNISEDHISPLEHSDFEDYFAAKKRIADISKKLILNADSPEHKIVAEGFKADSFTFGIENEDADYYGYYIRPKGHGTSFYVRSENINQTFTIPMKGDFNVSNALAAIAAADLKGIPPHIIERGLAKAHVEGRMEIIASQDGKINIIVDYAHNKLSFKTLFENLKKEFIGRDIVVVFGCAGEKAYDRRRELPPIAAEYCKHIYVTSVDPGYEPFEKIASEIVSNMPEGAEYTVIEDRETAVLEAFNNYGETAVVVLAGKGRDKTQRTAEGYVPYISDYTCALEYVEQYNKNNTK